MKWTKWMSALLCLALLSGCGGKAPAPDAEPSPSQSAEGPADAQSAGQSVPDFTTVDLSGNAVTQEVFGQADVTVVNIWGTFCPPCIGEMPELGDWAREMEDNVQLLGIVCDYYAGDDATLDQARTILQDSGADFVNLAADPSMEEFLSQFQFVPTTLLVDSEGALIGEPIVGADVALYQQAVADYLGQ